MRGFSVIFVVLLTASVLADKKEGFKKYADECIQELDIKKNDKGWPDMKDAEEKCFAKCVGLKTKMIDDNGKLIEENVPEKMKKLAMECNEKAKETDSCKRASEMMKCTMAKHIMRKEKKNKDE